MHFNRIMARKFKDDDKDDKDEKDEDDPAEAA